MGTAFTVGVAVGAVCDVNVWRGDVWAAIFSVLTLFVAATLMIFLSKSRLQSVFTYYILFAALGFFCYCNCPPYHLPSPLQSLLEKFTALIGSIPFRNPDTGALVTALLSGDRTEIPREIKECFRLSGASHILALSGLHLGVIYMIVARLLKPLGNSPIAAILRSAIIVTFCLFYTLLTGANPSTVRAFLFIALRETLRHFPGREVTNLRIFSTALLVQLVFDASVITSLGFQLSYLAMLGIFVVYPHLKTWYPDSGNALCDKWMPSKWIWNSVALSISCQLFTAPLVYLKFGTFPTYFLLTNLLSLPLAELLIISATACTVLQILLPSGCPAILSGLTDLLSERLIFVLQVISSM